MENACISWYPLVKNVHRILIAVARTVVNDGRGPKRHVLDLLLGLLLGLLSPTSLWIRDWQSWTGIRVSPGDIATWPF